MLVTGVAREDDFVGINVVFGGGGDMPGFGNASAQSTKNCNASNTQAASARELTGEKERTPKRDARVDQAKKHGRANEAQARHKQDREQKRSSERAEIIEGKDVSDDITEAVTVLDDSHQQRDFQTDEN